MISNVSGIVIASYQGQVEVCLKSIGINFALFVPDAAKFEINSQVSFFTYLHWNQEQGPTLFGFEQNTQRSLFIALIGCTGIGPKMAMAILEQLGVGGFVNAILQQDLKQLSTVSGIGSKKAEQIIVQLKHKIDKLVEQKEFSNLNSVQHIAEVRNVLLSLNYSNPEIVKALDYIKQNSSEQAVTFDAALRRALSFLAKNV
jgi:Holliday junction DNA helicase RuvA